MEIDLGELELYEQKICEKRRNMTAAERGGQHNELRKNDQIDELDEYLDRLSIEINEREQEQKVNATTHSPPSTATASVASQSQVCRDAHTSAINSSQLNYNSDSSEQKANEQTVDGQNKCTNFINSQTSLPLLLYTFMGLLVFMNSVYCKNRLHQIKFKQKYL